MFNSIVFDTVTVILNRVSVIFTSITSFFSLKWQCLSVWDFLVQFIHLFVWTDLPSITGQMMDSKTENEVSHNLEQCFYQDAAHYAVNYSHGRMTNEVSNLLLYSAHHFTVCL